MNSAPLPSVPAPRRRRLWPWFVGAAAGCMLAAIATVVSAFLPGRDVAALHRAADAAFPHGLHRRVQVSLGVVGITTARLIVRGLDDVPAEARQALAAVKAASVGVYQLDTPATPAARARLLAQADEAMSRRGWVRMVGVSQPGQTVAVYADADADPDDVQHLGVLVCDGRDVVIASVAADPAPLLELLARPGGLMALR
jgi:hypothetical protein